MCLDLLTLELPTVTRPPVGWADWSPPDAEDEGRHHEEGDQPEPDALDEGRCWIDHLVTSGVGRPSKSAATSGHTSLTSSS